MAESLVNLLLEILVLIIYLILLEALIIAFAYPVIFFVKYVRDIFLGRRFGYSDDLIYRVPFVPFYLGSFTIFGGLGLLHILPNVIALFSSIFIYDLVYFIAMYMHYKDDLEEYKKVVEENESYIKLCMNPASVFISVAGFYLAVTGLHLQNWQNPFRQLMQYVMITINSLLRSSNLISIKQLTEVITTIIMFLILSYLSSLLIQAFGYNIIKFLYYWADTGTYYKNLWKDTFTLGKLIKEVEKERKKLKKEKSICNKRNTSEKENDDLIRRGE